VIEERSHSQTQKHVTSPMKEIVLQDGVSAHKESQACERRRIIEDRHDGSGS
jgi:hypothetical protein